MDTLERVRPSRPRWAPGDAPTPAKPGAWRWILGFVLVCAAVATPLGILGAQKQKVVLMGDSLTAESSLNTALFLSPLGYEVQSAALGGSGLLDTKVNWVANARALVAQDDPNIVVVEFIGDYGIYGTPPGLVNHSLSFYADWAKVAQQLENVLTSRGATVYWVIGPPVAIPANSAAIAILDHIYEHLRAPTPSGHPPTINVTPALTGGTGKYTEYLPGPNGTPVEVRTPDGTHFTAYGVALFSRVIAEAIAH